MTLNSALLSFAVVAAVMTITPGLDTALVLRTAAVHGRRRAAAAALGISAGVLIWGLAAAVGVSALLTASELAYTVLRYAGAAYMVWLGIGMLRRALRPRAAEPDLAPGTPLSPWAYFRQGLLVNLLNPKIGAFYIALLPQFMPQDTPPAVAGILLAAVHNVEGLLWFALLIIAVDRMRALLSRPAAHRWIDGLAGVAVIGFGVRVAVR